MKNQEKKTWKYILIKKHSIKSQTIFVSNKKLINNNPYYETRVNYSFKTLNMREV